MNPIARLIELAIFSSRWLVVPFLLGLIAGLAILLAAFMVRLADFVVQVRGAYPGLHALRHFYASWCINRSADGGLELPLKVVQNRLGHANISITADVYGHLFPRADDGDEMAAAERAFLGG